MTNISGPYDHIPHANKTRVQACIPNAIHEDLFLNIFPRRGVQDKVICKFLSYLHKKSSELEPGNSVKNEEQLNKILSIFDDE